MCCVTGMPTCTFLDGFFFLHVIVLKHAVQILGWRSREQLFLDMLAEEEGSKRSASFSLHRTRGLNDEWSIVTTANFPLLWSSWASPPQRYNKSITFFFTLPLKIALIYMSLITLFIYFDFTNKMQMDKTSIFFFLLHNFSPLLY